MTSPRDLGLEFADYIVGATYDAIPLDAVEAAKKSILDLLGVILAASGVEPAMRHVLDFVEEIGGAPESAVLGVGKRAPAIWAAFANGAMAHGLDFDDLTPWGNHATSSIVPPAFAIAERIGGVSGKDMIAAVAIGQDLFTRLLRNVDWRKDWNMSTVAGVFAGTAAAGHLLKLSHEQMTNALAIACMQSAGTMEVIYGIGGDLRGMYAGFSSKASVLSVLLARKNITGAKTTFEGKAGFFNTYFGGRHDRAKLLEGLGRDYKGNTTLFKPWPAVGPAHSHIHATIGLMTEHDLRPEDIREIRVHIGDYHQIMCSPLDMRRAPTTLVDAKFSLPFLVAIAAVRRNIRVSDFTGGALKDPAVLAMSQRITPVADPAFDWKLELPAGRVDIVTNDGRTLERVGTNVPGSPDAPLTWEAISQKFGECAVLAAVPPSTTRVETAKQMARQLELLTDATALLHELKGDGT